MAMTQYTTPVLTDQKGLMSPRGRLTFVYTLSAARIKLTLIGLLDGSDVVILDAGTTRPRVNVDSNAGDTYTYVYSVYDTFGFVDVGVFKAGYVPFYVRHYPLSESINMTLPVAQVIDRSYAT